MLDRTLGRDRRNVTQRVHPVVIAILCAFALLWLRLTHLQVVQGKNFEEEARKNRIRLLRLPAPRGYICDRHGAVLVDNRPTFKLSVIPAEMTDPQSVIDRLSRLVDFDVSLASRQLDTYARRPFRHITMKDDLLLEQVLLIEEQSLDLPGVLVQVEPRRRYIYGELAASVLGYMGQIDERQLESMRVRGYRPGDLVGKTGVEKQAEDFLRGKDGGMQVQVHSDSAPQVETDLRGRPNVRTDAAGRRLRILSRKDPVVGNKIILNIDLETQQFAERLLEGKAGAIVIMEAHTGEVLAMASKPAYDPNIFASPLAVQDQKLLLEDDSAHSLLNRALRAYTPGSVFKIVVVHAALTEGTITPDTQYECTGTFPFGDRDFLCWKEGGHGKVDLKQALAYSCDIYFYQVGHELGSEKICEYASKFGFGDATAIDLSGELPGLIPLRNSRRDGVHRPQGRRWYPGDTLNLSIGQGAILVTPIQMATVMAALINGGHLLKPQILRAVDSPTGETIVSPSTIIRKTIHDDSETFPVIVDGLRASVRLRHPFFGTAWRMKLPDLDVIGKTGTAQVVARREDIPGETEVLVPYSQRDHAWFVGAVLNRQPTYVVSILVEHAGHASEAAVPLANDIFKHLYEDTELVAMLRR